MHRLWKKLLAVLLTLLLGLSPLQGAVAGFISSFDQEGRVHQMAERDEIGMVMDTQGKLPPPPLDGTAHTWHHPLSILRRTIRVGGVPLGGTMPGFADKLNSEQINDILAWVQDHWPDKIYRIWHERNAQASKPLQPIKKG